MIRYTEDELKTMTKEHAEADISNTVYAACSLFETLECIGKIRGNGHHLRQQVAQFASALLKERWVSDPVVEEGDPQLIEWAEEAKQILDEFSQLAPDWDDQGAEPPNAVAIRHARHVLSESIKMGFRPLSIAPCVEEGITFSFLIGKNLAAIECYNTDEIVAVTSGNKISPEIWEVSETGLREALEKTRVFTIRQLR